MHCKLSAYAQERAATINASSLNVRSGAGTSYSSVGKLGKGAAVTVVGEKAASDGKTWYQIRYTSGGSTQTGYVLSTYVKFPVSYSHDSSFESQLSAQGFPESYKTGLRQIHAQYPNWTFTAVKTGLDWNTVIQNEGVLGRNLVHTNSISSYKSLADGAYNWDSGTWTGFDGNTWVAASTEIISYYMDPRNFLDEVNVFQFLDQSYNASLHTAEGLQFHVKGNLYGRQCKNGCGCVRKYIRRQLIRKYFRQQFLRFIEGHYCGPRRVGRQFRCYLFNTWKKRRFLVRQCQSDTVL